MAPEELGFRPDSRSRRVRWRATLVAAALAAALPLLIAAPRPARAQPGIRGTTGTGTLSSSDLFVGLQREKGSNLTDLNKARFLNRASCACARPAYLFVSLQPSAVAKAATLPTNATVSVYIGSQCNNTVNIV